MYGSIFLLLLFSLLPPPTIASDYDAIESHLNSTFDENLSNLIDLLRFPSVSALPKHKSDVRAAGNWLKEHLTSIGLENARLLETPLHPSVYADWLHAPGAPTVLIYAHYDVQPADPFNLWTTPPFEPSVRDGRVFARGACDDKGNLMVPVTAIAAYLKVSGKLPVNIKVFFEGEEEIGSPNVEALLQKHHKLLRADYAFSADGSQVDLDIPGICLGFRGCVALEVTVRGGDVDLHSGLFGGGVQNALHALSHILASMRDIHTGRILVDGFYDDVDEISDEMRGDAVEFPKAAENFLRSSGVRVGVGEKGFSFYERTWYRPSLEIVGMGGGFQGEGVKTVLPREAKAKITSRIVTSQKTEKVRNVIRAHIEREAAKIDGITVTVENLSFKADAYKMDRHTPGNEAATKVLTEIYGRKPAYFRMGGSIAIVTHLQSSLGLDTTTFSFGNNDEKAHAPNEFTRIDSLRKGQIAYVRLLAEVGKIQGKEEL